MSENAASENIAGGEDNVSSPQPLSPVDRPTLNIKKITSGRKRPAEKKAEELSDSKTVDNGPATLESRLE